jgi:hypothetical protein
MARAVSSLTLCSGTREFQREHRSADRARGFAPGGCCSGATFGGGGGTIEHGVLPTTELRKADQSTWSRCSIRFVRIGRAKDDAHGTNLRRAAPLGLARRG